MQREMREQRMLHPGRSRKSLRRSMGMGQVLLPPVEGGVLWEKVRAIGLSRLGVVFVLFRWVLGRCVRAMMVFEDIFV